MRAIIGLGNPGSEYDGTRHNIGFAVVDAVAERYKLRFRAGRGEYWYAGEGNVILVKPATYMNNSGIAVKGVLERYNIKLEDIIIVVDDFHLPLGTLRLRRKGSSAGHNGVASLLWHLGSDEFPRLRCGIESSEKPKDRRATAEFVLSRFAQHEFDSVQDMIARARDISILAAEKNIQAAMDYLSTITN